LGAARTLTDAVLTSVVRIATIAGTTWLAGAAASGACTVETAQTCCAALLSCEDAARKPLIAARITRIGAAPFTIGIADALLLLRDVFASVIAAASDDDESKDGKTHGERGADSIAALWPTRRILRRTAVLNDETHGTPP
jgi:hypothetical protein